MEQDTEKMKEKTKRRMDSCILLHKIPWEKDKKDEEGIDLEHERILAEHKPSFIFGEVFWIKTQKTRKRTQAQLMEDNNGLLIGDLERMNHHYVTVRQ